MTSTGGTMWISELSHYLVMLRTCPSSLLFELLFTFQVQLCSMESANSAHASAMDVFLFQCLKEWNGPEEIVKKFLVILLLYVITELHNYICTHS